MDDDPETVVFSFAEHGSLLPPPADCCQQCGRKHEPEEPHDAQSLHYQYWYVRQRGRWPKWADALAHCAPDVQESWREQLRKRGVVENQFVVNEDKDRHV